MDDDRTVQDRSGEYTRIDDVRGGGGFLFNYLIKNLNFGENFEITGLSSFWSFWNWR